MQVGERGEGTAGVATKLTRAGDMGPQPGGRP